MLIASQDMKVTFIPDCARTISRRRSLISLSLCLLWSFLLCYMSFKSRAIVIFTRLDIFFTKRVWVAMGRYQDHSYNTTAFGARTFVSMWVPSIVIFFCAIFFLRYNLVSVVFQMPGRNNSSAYRAAVNEMLIQKWLLKIFGNKIFMFCRLCKIKLRNSFLSIRSVNV